MAFDTNDYSFHGLPDPINFPKGHARRSIILYYYTKESRPSDKTAIEASFCSMEENGID